MKKLFFLSLLAFLFAACSKTNIVFIDPEESIQPPHKIYPELKIYVKSKQNIKKQVKTIKLAKGKAAVFEVANKNLLAVRLNDIKYPFFTNPTRPDYSLIVIAMPYRNYKVLKLSIDFKEKSELYIINPTQGQYKKEHIKVKRSKVSPSKIALKRIRAEYRAGLLIYTNYTKQTLFKKPFIQPLNSATTSAFGTARIFNGKLKSFHSGHDYRAKLYTKVIAANDGIIRLVEDRYFAGKSIVIDHGQGIYTQYYHLFKYKVKKGQRVKRGQLISLSGATGRVSGPHLHFGVRVHNTQVDPLDFIKKINKYL